MVDCFFSRKKKGNPFGVALVNSSNRLELLRCQATAADVASKAGDAHADSGEVMLEHFYRLVGLVEDWLHERLACDEGLELLGQLAPDRLNVFPLVLAVGMGSLSVSFAY